MMTSSATSHTPTTGFPTTGPSQVCGRGMWNSWTRNFQSPLLAFLDLLDNSFDAALARKPVPATTHTTREAVSSAAADMNNPPNSEATITLSAARDAINEDFKLRLAQQMQRQPSHYCTPVLITRQLQKEQSEALSRLSVGCRYRGRLVVADDSELRGQHPQEPSDDDFKGYVDLAVDTYVPPPRRRTAADLIDDNDGDNNGNNSDDEDWTPRSVTGLVITNNSRKPIKPISEIMVPYSSAKGRDEHGNEHYADTIGENGVGLKQSCATLSDLSFVLVRNEDKLSLGILAKRLQTDTGICLKSFEFESKISNDHSLRREMETKLGKGYLGDVTLDCVGEYGQGSVSHGIHRLVAHYSEMNKGPWTGNFVFRLVMDRPKHGHPLPQERNSDNEAEGPQCKSNAEIFLQKVKADLPRQYIHIPEDFTFRIEGERIKFCYWQSRLVEINTFEQRIDTVNPVRDQNRNWQCPEGDDTYRISILCGFDPNTRDKNAKLFIYSRNSGRLIKVTQDCRLELGLVAGSTDFCQGLCIIVDDMDGELPLNPTKQDIAFGEQSRGAVHQRNLYSWIGAVAHTYYSYYKNLRGGRKENLTEAVQSYKDDLPTSDASIPSINEAKFTKFRVTSWKLYLRSNKPNVEVMRPTKGGYDRVIGPDTRWAIKELPPPPLPPAAAAAAVPVVPRTAPTLATGNSRKRRAVDGTAISDYATVNTYSTMPSHHPAQRWQENALPPPQPRQYFLSQIPFAGAGQGSHPLPRSGSYLAGARSQVEGKQSATPNSALSRDDDDDDEIIFMGVSKSNKSKESPSTAEHSRNRGGTKELIAENMKLKKQVLELKQDLKYEKKMRISEKGALEQERSNLQERVRLLEERLRLMRISNSPTRSSNTTPTREAVPDQSRSSNGVTGFLV